MGKLLQMAGQTNGEGGENGTGDEHDYEHRMSIPSVHGIWMQMIGPGGEVIRQFQVFMR
jgi:hypothetical protein